VKFVFSIDRDAIKERAAVAAMIRAYLQGTILQNCYLVRDGLVPRLYESGIRYVLPRLNAQGEQEYLSALETLKRGAGSCPETSTWRAAELRVLGDARIGVLPCRFSGDRCVSHRPLNVLGHTVSGCPNIKIYWRPDFSIYHCETRSDSARGMVLEDTSRFLGMKGGAA
jgi:hypothetical protein